MLTLYYAPGACSISPHIALREAGVPFRLERVDFMRGKTTESGVTLPSVSPKGYVPALILDDGQLLTEGAAMVQYIADLRPESKLAPPPGTFERVRLQEWLNFIATELHKGSSPLYSPIANEEYKTSIKERLAHRLGVLARGVAEKPWLMGDTFTVADGYALYALRVWKRFSNTELDGVLRDYHERIMARPAVQAAFEAERIK